MSNKDILKTLLDGMDSPVPVEFIEEKPLSRHGTKRWTWLQKIIHAMAKRPDCGAISLTFPNKKAATHARSAAQSCTFSPYKASNARTARRGGMPLLPPEICIKTSIRPVDSKEGAYTIAIWIETRKVPLVNE